MGTRGAFGFYVGGVTKVSYCQFDCYPEGRGQEALSCARTLLAAHGVDGLRERARAIPLVDERGEAPGADDKAALAGYTDLRVSEQTSEDWYCLFRGAQGHLDAYLEAGMMPDNADFLGDSLFCEWAYVVNLDADPPAFEVYQGFQETPHDRGRYAPLPFEREAQSVPPHTYYPVALVAEVPLAGDADLLEALEAAGVRDE